MNKVIIPILVLAISFTFLSNQGDIFGKAKIEKYSHEKFTSAPPSGRTGAPGEATCTACHSGTVMNGDMENLFTLSKNGNVVTEYTPGETYDVSLAMASSPSRKGFQATVLTSTADAAGSFITVFADGVGSQTGMGRSYASHNFNSSSNAVPVWNWQWVAPSAAAGDVIFYVATNKANDNGQNGGDQIFTSSHTISGETASIEQAEKMSGFQAGYNAETKSIYLTYDANFEGTSSLNLVDLNGRSVLSLELNQTIKGTNKNVVRVPSYIKSGRYFIHFFADNHSKYASVVISE
jgi:hypothetical protein